jgi:hypothetical protein
LIKIFDFEEFGVAFHVDFLLFDNVVDFLVEELHAFIGEDAFNFGVDIFFDDDWRMGDLLLDCECGEHLA